MISINIKRVCFPVAVLICFAACNKIDSNIKTTKSGLKQFLAIGDSATIYNYVLINSNQKINPYDSSFTTGLTAAFTDSITGQTNSIQSLAINNRIITPGPGNAYEFQYADSTSPSADTTVRIWRYLPYEHAAPSLRQ